MRIGSWVRYALLGMVAENSHSGSPGVHGWGLRKQCDQELGTFCQLNLGEIYRVLEQLADDGLIEQTGIEPGSNRKNYCITKSGRRSLNHFLFTPPTDARRPLRQELAVKLKFAPVEELPRMLDVITQQREIYMEELVSLNIQRRKLRRRSGDGFVTGLLIDGAEFQVRAQLAWLDHLAQKLKEHTASTGTKH